MQAKTANRCVRAALLLMFLAVANAFLPPAHSGQPKNKGEQAPAARPIEQTGIAAPFEQVDIYARVTGQITAVSVERGNRVKKGQVLAKLAAPDLEKKLEKKKALAEKAQNGVAQAKKDALVLAAAATRSKLSVEEATADLRARQTQLGKWTTEKSRSAELLAKGVIDAATHDQVVKAMQSAQANELEAKAKIKKAAAAEKEATARRDKGDVDIEAALANLQTAKAEVAQVNTLLEFTEIRAPFDSVVMRRNVMVGAAAGPPVNAKSEPLFTLARIDRMRIVVEVSEKDALRVAKGMAATIRFKALNDQVFKETVTRTAGTIDLKKRTLRVEIDLPNPDGKVLPNMLATVILTPNAVEPKKKD